MASFWLGKIVERHKIKLFPENTVEIIEYHPHIFINGRATKEVDSSKTMFHIEEFSQSADSIPEMILAYIAYKNLGCNQVALVSGIARMLKLGE